MSYQDNIDIDEISKFEVNATQWWDLNGKFRTLHRINAIRLDYILSRAEGLFGKKVLDVGCGGGILAESMTYAGAEVTGLDIGTELLTVARLHACKNGMVISYVEQTVEEHAQTHSNAHYDVITCMEVLEHVPNPSSIVQSCAYLVKPGGEVFFSTLNRSFKAWLMAVVCAEYILHIVPRGTHDFNKFIKPAELLSWADDVQLSEQHIIGLHYNLFRDHFYLDRNVDVNYILHTRRLQFP